MEDKALVAGVVRRDYFQLFEELVAGVVRPDRQSFDRSRRSSLACAYNRLTRIYFRCIDANAKVTAYAVRGEYLFCQRGIDAHVRRHADVYAGNNWKMRG